MKKLFLPAAIMLFCATHVFAQDEPTNCYLKWAKLFEERGAEEVEDGVNENVIISFRRGTKAECFNGKVEVKAGKIIGIWLRFEGGTYEPLEKKFKHNDKNQVTSDIKIVNGMSTTMVTEDDQLINVIFYKKLKPKKKSYEKAPEPGIGD
jgi:hypothetical protein